MNNLRTEDFTSPEREEIRRLRQILTAFIPAAGSLEVVFQLPGGGKVHVPINRLAKVRAISQEVRNYLAEEQIGQDNKEQETVK
jgi:hypothetical protein